MYLPVEFWKVIPYDYPTDWNRIAKLIVHESLQTQPHERVLIHADPSYFPKLTEQVRIEVTKAGAVEVASMLFYSPGLDAVRRRLRRREDAELRRAEDDLMRAVFGLADIYVWLPTSWAVSWGQTEEIIKTWHGRSLHFHWIAHVVDPVVFRKLSEQYERALFIDYAALTSCQKRLADAVRGAAVHVTNDHGTDLTFTVQRDAHFHFSNGDASKAYIEAHARPGSARDREVELPCGLIRTIDIGEAEGQMVFGDETFGDRRVGKLRVEFKGGRVKKITSEYHSAWAEALWEQETGDRDRAGEFIIGCNPELRPIPGIAEIPYWGSGAGVVRLNVGDNSESGGRYRSSFQLGHFLTDATVTANGRTIVERGELVFS